MHITKPTNPALVARICEQLADGDKSLRAICRDEGISHSLVLLWARDDADFANQYARAREIGADAAFDSLSDDMAEKPPVLVGGGIDSAWVAWKRVQVDVKKWSLSKRAAKKYGDKLELGGPDGGAIPIKVIVDL